MLVLTRKPGESIYIDSPEHSIRITVTRVGTDHARIGISAPGFTILREEIVKQREEQERTNNE